MKNSYFLILVVFVCSIFITACVQQETIAPETPVLIQKDSLPDKLLTLSDMPVGYSMDQTGERQLSEVAQQAIDLGWESGYYVKFSKLQENVSDPTVLQQYVSIYPTDKVLQVLDISYTSDETNTYELLASPGIGDKSRAFSIKFKDVNGTIQQQYRLEFAVKNVYENFLMAGYGADYETLRDLATTAAAKI